MSPVKSLDELKKLREAALEKRQVQKLSGEKKVIVGMGTSGIAAGARQTMKAILDYVEKHDLLGIVVTQTGGLGLDAKEPIVQVEIGDAPKVTYGNVTPEAACRIMEEHVVNGNIVQDFLIPI